MEVNRLIKEISGLPLVYCSTFHWQLLHSANCGRGNRLDQWVGHLHRNKVWDTSTGTKSNRSPMHTGTVTLLFVDVESGEVAGMATYPNMGGPGKIDHGSVFHRFQEDMASFESGSCRVFQSVHFDGDVEVHSQILFVVQDQPERRQASGLLGCSEPLVTSSP